MKKPQNVKTHADEYYEKNNKKHYKSMQKDMMKNTNKSLKSKQMNTMKNKKNY